MLKQFRTYFLEDVTSKTESLHKLSQINLLYNIASVVFLAGIIVTCVSLIIGTYPVLIPAFGNISLALAMLFILKRGNLKLAAGFYFTTLFVLLFGNIIFNSGVMHIGSPFWVMLLNVLVMYILGVRWGIAFIAASILAFGYYIIFILPVSIEIAQELPPEIYYSVVYETVIVLSVLGYVIWTILKASTDSDIVLKKKNEALHSRNEEKEVMLKEIHHRVKNNLQVIISLMRLKMHEISDLSTREHYQDTINRVHAMAKIHEKIYQSNEISKVDLQHYFKDLTQELLQTYETDKKVDFFYDIRVDKMDLDHIVPLALIFNELFSNSLEHGFDQTEFPRIDLRLSSSEDHLHFEYQDNGQWKASDQDNSFGLELIDTLVQQLDGELEFEKTPTRYRLKI